MNAQYKLHTNKAFITNIYQFHRRYMDDTSLDTYWPHAKLIKKGACGK